MSGFAGGDVPYKESLDIFINVKANDEASGTIQKVDREIEQLGTTTENTTKDIKDNKEIIDAQVRAMRDQISPIRSVSWDLQLMGRSMSIVNKEFLGNNELIRRLTGAIYGLGAAMRIIVTIRDAEIALIELGIIKSAAKTTANIAEAGSTMTLAGASATLQAVLGNPMALTALAVGAGVAAGVTAGYLGSMKTGGYVKQTGPYLLHKGETVVPAGSTNFSNINISMTAGNIASNVDVDNMLDNMARRMLVEKRRRGI